MESRRNLQRQNEAPPLNAAYRLAGLLMQAGSAPVARRTFPRGALEKLPKWLIIIPLVVQ